MDMRERYRRSISYLHHEFDWGVERLKKAKAMQDLEILEHADVIGMTTTGELVPVSAVILEASRFFQSIYSSNFTMLYIRLCPRPTH